MEHRSNIEAAGKAALPGLALAAAGAVLTLVFSELGTMASAAAAALGAGAAFFAGQFWPAKGRGRRGLEQVAGELEDYRAFPRLLQSQHDRIVDHTAHAAHAIAMAVRALDENAQRVAEGIDQRDRGGEERAVSKLRQDILDITQPAYAILAELQFQDITQQQLAFLNKLARLLDDHMGELARHLDANGSAGRFDIRPFREAFDTAMSDTVMRSQRNDLKAAKGVDHVEETAPVIELFV